jgi:hypothetical protein
MKYWMSLGPSSLLDLFRYLLNEGIWVLPPAPLKGLSKLEPAASEALRVCSAVQPARATGIECWVHERAIARVVVARAGIVDA